MVVIVAIALSFVAMVLKPYQEANVKTEKIQNILSSVNITSDKKNASDLYKKYITKEYLIKSDGTFREGNAFDVPLKAELKKEVDKREMPLFIADIDAESFYIIPLWGRGLWGAIWGYMSLKYDMNTIYGSVFDHKSETPGLGAEIANAEFQQQFFSKQIFDESGKFVSVKIMKGGAPEGDIHAVDAISGGTITSDGVNAMIKENLSFYVNYFMNNKNTNYNE